jgi:hypothetical protein
MLGTLLPGAQPPTGSGDPTPKSWRSGALWLHLAGGALGGAAFGLVVSLLGRGLPIEDRRTAALLAAGLVGGIYALREAGLMHVPAPQSRRQVPNRWRWMMPGGMVAFLYGSTLGIGVATPITTTSYYPLVVWVALRADFGLGGLVLGLYGLARALPLLLPTFDTDGPRLRSTIDRLVTWMPLVGLVNALALAALVGFTLAVVTQQ